MVEITILPKWLPSLVEGDPLLVILGRMIYSASETSRLFLMSHYHLQTFTIVSPSKHCVERDSNYDEGWTKEKKDVVLQSHLTPFYCCGYGNHTLALQVLSQLPL
jgi:hypothetical protein